MVLGAETREVRRALSHVMRKTDTVPADFGYYQLLNILDSPTVSVSTRAEDSVVFDAVRLPVPVPVPVQRYI